MDESAQGQATSKLGGESRDQLASHKRGSGALLMSPPDRGVIAHWISQSWLAVSTPTIISGFARWGFVNLHSVVEEEPYIDDTTDLVAQLPDCDLVDSKVGDVSVLADFADSAISMEQ
uniref:AlNc14C646G12329 protein n=1 Tax=Albugo laibachii Nc14 TaxID=890382 RepID=F0X1L8_9STRA|nr:AlNc14C646G12329 [Albugo laibachii Nc14]|eukprot:CCA27713.1 AlNc14C646G12329 [Albugo laibachii Nc14]